MTPLSLSRDGGYSDEILTDAVEVAVKLPRLLPLVALYSLQELLVGIPVGQIVQRAV